MVWSGNVKKVPGFLLGGLLKFGVTGRCVSERP